MDQHKNRRTEIAALTIDSNALPTEILSSKQPDRKKNLAAPYPFDTSAEITRLIEKFERTKRSQNVSFRKLVPWIKVGERATHYIHSYPAKLLPQIAHFFLASEALCSKNEIVLDPFGGTGTVALETMLSGRRANYTDANPLARLIARAKTSKISDDLINQAVLRILSSYKKTRKSTPPDVVNINHWFTESTIKKLSRLKHSIDLETESPEKDFLLVCFSSTVRKVSLADPRLSVPVRRKDAEQNADINVIDVFMDQLNLNIKRHRELSTLLGADHHSTAFCVGEDARNIDLPDQSVGMIITSPPYAGAQKYIRASSLSLGWLGYAKRSDLKPLENQSIGREHLPKEVYAEPIKTGVKSADSVISKIYAINKLRAAIVATYLVEMNSAIQEMTRVLKPGGIIVLVIGNNEVCGHLFNSAAYLEEMLLSQGLHLKLRLIDEIKSRGLMTKRNREASIITREWILLLQKAEQ